MKNFFEGIAWLFEEILFLPYAVLRELEQRMGSTFFRTSTFLQVLFTVGQ